MSKELNINEKQFNKVLKQFYPKWFIWVTNFIAKLIKIKTDIN